MNEKRKLLPPTYLLVSIVMILLVHFTCPLVTPIRGMYRVLGLVPMGMGIALNIMADRSFKTPQTTVRPFEKSTSLITVGVFRISRNPMYLGMVLLLLGITLTLGSMSPLFIVAVFALLMDIVFVRAEEEKMIQEFGDEFSQYMHKVRRWI